MVREATEAAQLNRYVGDQPSSEYHELRTRLSLREAPDREPQGSVTPYGGLNLEVPTGLSLWVPQPGCKTTGAGRPVHVPAMPRIRGRGKAAADKPERGAGAP